MNDINNLNIVGHLARDVEIKYTSGGMAIADGAIAVNRSVKDRDGYHDQASFFDFSIFGKAAENLKPYLIKGKQIAISGYLKRESWTDKETGNNRSKIKICANEVQLLGGGSNSNGNGGCQAQSSGYDAAGFGYGETF